MFSTAFNNAEHLEGSADQKTGSYSFRHRFATVQSNGIFGPKCNLSMTFETLSTMNDTNPTGLGTGWSFKLGHYSHDSKQLTLNTGESYEVLRDYNTKSWELSHKLKDLRVWRRQNGKANAEEIHICNKNGDLEIMKVDPKTKDAVITRFISATGHFLCFKYRSRQGYKRLIGVYDSDTCDKPLATINYGNSSKVKVVTHPGAPEECISTLHLNSAGFLHKIEGPESEAIHFDYESIKIDPGTTSLHPLKKVTYSSGATEAMEYNKKLHLPSQAPLPYIIAISKHTKRVAANQPPILTTFEYDGDHNCWGGGDSGVVWGSNKDSLLYCRSRYRYSSYSKCGEKVIKCKYNKFHQMISKIETNGQDSHKTVTTYDYYSDEGGVLDGQTIEFELVKKEAMHYERGSEHSQQFIKTYKYDEWGNTTEEIDSSGLCTVSEYYKPQGEEGCPEHPFEMTAFVKRKTVHFVEDESQCKEFLYTYQSFTDIGAVFPLTEQHGNMTKSFDYYDKNDPALCGVSKSETVTVNGKSTTTLWKYHLQDSFIKLVETVTGHDEKRLTRSTKLSYWTGLIYSEMDESGAVTAYTRDKMGRLLSETTGEGAEYESKTTYRLDENTTDPEGTQQIGFRVEEATATGATVQTFYDAEHNELAAYQKDEHGIMRKLSEKHYDNQQRVVSESTFDYVTSETGQMEETIRKGEIYMYDPWGNKSETHYSDGTVDTEIKDPIALTTTRQTKHKDGESSLHKAVTTQDKYGNHISTETLTPAGESYSKVTFTYDGFGRKTSFTTPTGLTARILAYDAADRPTKFEHYDGTAFEVSYADFSTENLVSSIFIPSRNYRLGVREFDGLSRVTGKTVNGAKTQFRYAGGTSHPTSQVNAEGNTTLFDYIPELDMQVSRVAYFTSTVSDDAWEDQSKVSELAFTYSKEQDASHGSITSASTSSSRYLYNYTKGGFNKTVSQIVGEKSHTIIVMKRTVADKPLLMKVGDRMVSYQYDENGEVNCIIDGEIKVEFENDVFGRLAREKVSRFNSTLNSHTLVQTTSTVYDEHSREISRNISIKTSGVDVTLKASYDAEDKLVQHVTAINNVDLLSESYSYDTKNRLAKHTASSHKTDLLLPQNENGRLFVSQSYAFDELDNITSIKTGFPNGDVDVATFVYDSTNKQRITRISHTLTTGENAYQPPAISFAYDRKGNLVGRNGSKMTYTISGRLSQVDDSNYTYDAFDRLIQSNKTSHFYLGPHVVCEIDDTSTTNIIRCGDLPICEIKNDYVKFYGINSNLSVISVTGDSGNSTFNNYSAYGNSRGSTRIGFNGELRDTKDNGLYHLGNGTRAYFPSFCGFSSADTFSPFSGGGINPFTYACGNPINAIDPSGHLSFLSLLGSIAGLLVSVASLIALPFTGGSSFAIAAGIISGISGVVSSGLDIGAQVAEDNGDYAYARKLRIASFAIGAVGFIVGAGETALSVGRVMKSAGAAKAAANTGKMNVFAKAGDHFVTTAYSTKYSIRFKAYTPKEGDVFAVFKMKNAKTEGKFLKHRLIWERKKFGLYVRKIRQPTRILKEGQHMGRARAVLKNCQTQLLLQVLNTGLFGNSAYDFVSQQEEEAHEHRGESDSNVIVRSAHGLPMTPKQQVHAEKMLFQ